MKKIDKNKIKTWFVTGASSGIGYELCFWLLKRGYNVIAVSRNIAQFDSGGGNQDNLLTLSVDVTKPDNINDAVKKAVDKFGNIDVLANIAGISSYETFEETSDEEVRSVMETNYWGTYNTCKALIKYFREKNNGTIINCTSVIGLVPRTYGVAYSSSKHAIEGLTSVLWLETQNFNCRVMAVEPGLFPSNIAKNKKFFVSQFKEYIFPNNQIINLERNYKNDLSCGVNSIIDTVENEKIPRRLLLGKDCIQRVKYEIKMIQDNIKYSKSISNKIARTENNKRYTVINDISFNLKKILYFFNYIRCFILEKIGKKEKRSHYNQKKEILKNKFVKTWIKK